MKSTTDASPAVLPSDSLLPLESVLCTEELNRRPSRPRDYETENRALATLVQALADSPRTILQTLAETILEVFQSDSAGVSLLTTHDGGKRFYWPAIAGMWKPHIGGGTPRDFGPCGDVLDRNSPLLFRHFERRYAYFQPVTPPVEECLLVPFYVEGKVVGTIWAITHDDRRKFDAEDLRQLESLGRFTSAAYQAVAFLDALEQRGEALQQSHTELAQRVIELEKANVEIQDTRRGALNVMEDALQARQLVETLHLKLGSEITERERTEEAKARLAAIVESSDDAIISKNLNSVITSWNRGAERLFGYTAQEAVGQLVSMLMPAERLDEEPGILERVRRGETIEHYETVRRHKDGTLLDISLTVSPIVDAHGQIVGVSKIARDITERKRAEEGMKRAEEKLETTVAERTKELRQANLALLRDMEERKKLEEQLLQSQKMESVGTLAGGIAHDFNNILNIIQGYASILNKYSPKENELAEGLEAIRDAVQRGSGMVRQLLSVARKTQPSFEPTDANRVITELTKLLKETFPKTVELALDLTDVPLVMADANQINQVLLNLCVNARDAMPQGGKLLLKTEVVSGTELRQRFEASQEERYIRIRISDTGMGMNADTRRRIYEPFFTTKVQGKGTGLGLSVVYGIVNNHAGFVDLTSEVGQGSIFDIYLPLPKNKLEFVGNKHQRDGEQKGKRLGEDKTVLFVDDEIRQLRLMENFLESEGYKVLGASDGAEAVEMYRRHKDEIGVVVLDLRLPKLNGWECFQIMRKTQPNLKVLFATGFVSPEVETELAKGEIGGIIMKPYQLDEVLEKISELLQNP